MDCSHDSSCASASGSRASTRKHSISSHSPSAQSGRCIPSSVRGGSRPPFSRGLRSNSFAVAEFQVNSLHRLTPNTSFQIDYPGSSTIAALRKEAEPLKPRNREGPPRGTTMYKLATEMLKQHSQIGAKIDFKPMSSAAKIRHTRIIESRGRRALFDIRKKEERNSRLPMYAEQENESCFPCPVNPLISLKRKQVVRSVPRPKSELEKTEEMLKILRIPTELKRRRNARKVTEIVHMNHITTQTESARSSPEKFGGNESLL